MRNIFFTCSVMILFVFILSWGKRSVQRDVIQSPNNDSLLIEKMSNKIASLPEVQQSAHFIDSFTHHKHGISIIVMGKPDKENNYYWITAGYSSDERYETYYNFHVWPDKMIIRFYDTFTGKTQTLSQWRKTRKPSAVIK